MHMYTHSVFQTIPAPGAQFSSTVFWWSGHWRERKLFLLPLPNESTQLLLVIPQEGRWSVCVHQVIFYPTNARSDKDVSTSALSLCFCFYPHSVCANNRTLPHLSVQSEDRVGSRSMSLQDETELFVILHFNMSLCSTWSYYTYTYNTAMLGNGARRTLLLRHCWTFSCHYHFHYPFSILTSKYRQYSCALHYNIILCML